MNLYTYLMSKSNNGTLSAEEAKKAYERFQANGRTLGSQLDCDPFAFTFAEGGYEAFAFWPDQVVKNEKGELAIVTGWRRPAFAWLVRIKTVNGEYNLPAEELTPAAFPEGLVEIIRAGSTARSTRHSHDQDHVLHK